MLRPLMVTYSEGDLRILLLRIKGDHLSSLFIFFYFRSRVRQIIFLEPPLFLKVGRFFMPPRNSCNQLDTFLSFFPRRAHQKTLKMLNRIKEE